MPDPFFLRHAVENYKLKVQVHFFFDDGPYLNNANGRVVLL